jgi:glycosyltransferase involved in cell wall biosynthesis
MNAPHTLSSKDAPLVSIIIPCYNGERFLAAAIDSALAQDCAPVEVIVVDDGSQDKSFAIMESYGTRITVVSQSNSGLPAARNAGIRVSRGRYIAFLDCDDYLRKDFAATMVSALHDSGAQLAYCGWQNVGMAGRRGEPFIPPDYESDSRKILLLVSGVRWPVHAALVRRELVEEVGGFDPKWGSCEDFAFWIRAATLRKIVRVPEVLAFYRHHGEAQMTKKRALIARNHWSVQMEYLRENPGVRDTFDRGTVRRITHGALLARGYSCFWDRDLESAQKIFRWVIRTGYGSLNDWKYMLPAVLPLPMYRRLVAWFDERDRRNREKRPG